MWQVVKVLLQIPDFRQGHTHILSWSDKFWQQNGKHGKFEFTKKMVAKDWINMGGPPTYKFQATNLYEKSTYLGWFFKHAPPPQKKKAWLYNQELWETGCVWKNRMGHLELASTLRMEVVLRFFGKVDSTWHRERIWNSKKPYLKESSQAAYGCFKK